MGVSVLIRFVALELDAFFSSSSGLVFLPRLGGILVALLFPVLRIVRTLITKRPAKTTQKTRLPRPTSHVVVPLLP